jgi:hypothetical protein
MVIDPNRELKIERRHLRDRDQPLSSDVAEAIYRLVGNGATLPLALTKTDLVEKLIDIAHEAEDSEQLVPIRAAKRAMLEGWYNRLSNTAVFQSGYKHYEGRDEYGHFPVVPVTDYFFKVIYSTGAVTDVLDSMTLHEVRNSLPKRISKVANGDDYLRDEDGSIAHYGELAGIVVFSRNSRALLLRNWLERRSNTAIGQIESATASISNARPDTASVETLKEKIGGLKSTVTKALPRPKI